MAIHFIDTDYIQKGYYDDGTDLNLERDVIGFTNTNKKVVFGSKEGEQINGDGGKDKLYGMDGDDTINGGEGEDYIEGGYGNDILIGSENKTSDDGVKDNLKGGKGLDRYYVGDGDVIEDVKEDDYKDEGIIFLDDEDLSGVKVKHEEENYYYNKDGIISTTALENSDTYFEITHPLITCLKSTTKTPNSTTLHQ